MKTNKFEEYAVIDLGSNSFHMLIARYISGSMKVVYKQKRHVQLAKGLNQNNELDSLSIDRGIECLALFAERLNGFPAENVKIIATHSLRIATNRYQFLQQAFKVLPYSIEVIAGQEEARLIYVGMRTTVSTNNDEYKMIIDIGGGSTEIAIGNTFTPILAISRIMGCVTYTQQFFSEKRINHSAFYKAQLLAKQEVQNIIKKVKKYNITVAYGTSGTIKSIHNILLDLGVSDGIITPTRLNDLIRYVLQFERFKDINYPSLSDDRKPVFLAGLAIFSAVFEAFNLQELHYSQSALREGALFELIDDNMTGDIRQNTMDSLALQYNIDTSHAAQVTKTAKFLFQQWQLQSHGEMDPTLIAISYWAIQLHEVGLNINLSSIHKHSAYILQHSNLPGFNEEQQRLLSALVHNHRKSLNLTYFKELSLFEYKHIVTLVQIFRLAILLNSQRTIDLDLNALALKTCKENYYRLVLELDKKFAEKNKLITLSLEQEQKYWQAEKNWQLTVEIK